MFILLYTIRSLIQIRPSKFGGSFNQPNVPTINVVVDMVAPPTQDCQDNRRRYGCKSINHLIILIRKGSLEGMFLSDFFFFLPIHRDSAHFALLSYEHCRKAGIVFILPIAFAGSPGWRRRWPRSRWPRQWWRSGRYPRRGSAAAPPCSFSATGWSEAGKGRFSDPDP